MKRVAYYSSMFLIPMVLALPMYFIISLKAEKASLIHAGDEVILPDENIIVRVEKEVGETDYYLMSNSKVYKSNDLVLMESNSARTYEQKKIRVLIIYSGFLLLILCAFLWKGDRFISYAFSLREQ